MTLQTLEYFIAVAQYRNFTRAAEACLVTQPALSRAIRGLEEELGCPLLIRSGRTVELTPEGEVCLAEARRVLQQCEELKLRVREADWENKKPLRLGYIIASGLNTFLHCLEEKCPDGPPFLLETVYGDTGDIKKQLLSGELDAVVLPLPCMADLAGVEWKEIMRSGFYAIVHKNNALYKRKSLKMAELKDQNFIMWAKKDMPFIYAEEVHACQKAGFTPRIVGEAAKMGDMLAQVALYNGVGLTNRSTALTYSGEDHFIPVTDSPECLGLVCAWRKEDPSRQLELLKDLLGHTEKS